MDEGLTVTAMSFDTRLHPYIADGYHAMKRLINEGYITIKPNAKLRLGPRGHWEADGQPSLEESALREQGSITRHIPYDNRGPYLGEKKLETPVTRLIGEVKEVLMAKHDNAHPAWTTLQEALGTSNPHSWTEETLKRAITQANDKEVKDWDAFVASHIYCSGGRPDATYVEAVKGLIKALHHFCGLAVDEGLFMEVDPERDSKGPHTITRRRARVLKSTAESRDPTNAPIMSSYVTLVQLVANTNSAPRDIYIDMEGHYNSLQAIIQERMLGGRLLQLIRL